MQINILGTGHATAIRCFNTCFTITENKNEYFLVDSGGGNGILKQLEQSQISLQDIKAVFISHIHMDHILGVLWIIRILARKFHKRELINPIFIYGNDEVVVSLKKLCDILIPRDFLYLINDKIKLIIVKNNEMKNIIGFEIHFFDLSAKKAKQYGFAIKRNDANFFTFIGDEACDINTEKYLYNAQWLFADAYMAGEEAELYNPIEKHHHSTVKFVAELGERLKVKNLILSHTIDSNLIQRKESFIADARKYFSGKVYVPNDLEVIKI